MTEPRNNLAVHDEAGMFTDTRIQMIRDSVAKDAPESIFRAMIDIARKRNLDPLAKQIICVKFGGTWQYIVTIDGYRSIADQTGKYAGNDAPVFTWFDSPKQTSAKKTIPESATVTVYKMMNGQRYPFSATVYWEEYDGGRNNWVSMPRTMLAKVAETHALRKAFPAVLSGTYTAEEMDQAYVEVSGVVAHSTTGEIASTPTRSLPAPLDRSKENSRLHGIADDAGIPHSWLSGWAKSKGKASLSDVSAEGLKALADRIEANPDDAYEYFSKYAPVDESGSTIATDTGVVIAEARHIDASEEQGEYIDVNDPAFGKGVTTPGMFA